GDRHGARPDAAGRVVPESASRLSPFRLVPLRPFSQRWNLRRPGNCDRRQTAEEPGGGRAGGRAPALGTGIAETARAERRANPFFRGARSAARGRDLAAAVTTGRRRRENDTAALRREAIFQSRSAAGPHPAQYVADQSEGGRSATARSVEATGERRRLPR